MVEVGLEDATQHVGVGGDQVGAPEAGDEGGVEGDDHGGVGEDHPGRLVQQEHAVHGVGGFVDDLRDGLVLKVGVKRVLQRSLGRGVPEYLQGGPPDGHLEMTPQITDGCGRGESGGHANWRRCCQRRRRRR